MLSESLDLLATGELTLLGRIMPASNQTYLCRLGPEEDAPQAVYKPTSGERPLWDFEDGTLSNREYAAYLVSEALGWSVVPPTLLRDGPAGPGMVQLWCEPDAGADAVDVVAAGPVAPGWLHVVDAHDNEDRPVMLVHEDSPSLRRMAAFDLAVNNTDRKGGHVLAMADGHRYGVDHGVCFHEDDKLRTVLWGFAGLPLEQAEIDGLTSLRAQLDGDLGNELGFLLNADEIAATRRRVDRLLRTGAFPEAGGGWPSLPWPPF
ncbi:putative repeat protein (TIGR03843 family) [Marmoricola sp. OAE513]|uniref:SCO1664 family protein n=1 Tax=Marmoricola sp. OAE513 TaxID=2817894 RepID=UPI001AEB94BC